MALSNFTELKTAIENWMARSGDTKISGNADDFVKLAESQFNKAIRHRLMETRSTTTTTSGDEFVTTPSDMLELRSLVVQSDPTLALVYRSPQGLLQEHPYSDSAKPRHFTVVGDNFRVKPTPDATYTLEITYYQAIPPLSVSQPTNWLLTNYPEIYLYGCLYQASIYVQDDPAIQKYQSLLATEIDLLQKSSVKEQWNNSPLIPTIDVWTP